MNTHREAEALESALLDALGDYIRSVASSEPNFGHAAALLKHGQEFPAGIRKPVWLRMGARGACFNNATINAIQREDVFYAEGYAIDGNLPIPIHHAWLVNEAGEVIDPTWGDTIDHVYFGIAFDRSFVLETLAANNNEPGILVNLNLMRRRLRAPEAIERSIAEGQVRITAVQQAADSFAPA
ncbi:hypothetical protein [Rhizobium sp. 768_B6_N1_8]|uniref:hypothetical protein n=1 Tax=unclassified Rhizobium TaxID=2613769 RepID=UPI003F21A46D